MRAKQGGSLYHFYDGLGIWFKEQTSFCLVIIDILTLWLRYVKNKNNRKTNKLNVFIRFLENGSTSL